MWAACQLGAGLGGWVGPITWILGEMYDTMSALQSCTRILVSYLFWKCFPSMSGKFWFTSVPGGNNHTTLWILRVDSKYMSYWGRQAGGQPQCSFKEAGLGQRQNWPGDRRTLQLLENKGQLIVGITSKINSTRLMHLLNLGAPALMHTRAGPACAGLAFNMSYCSVL